MLKSCGFPMGGWHTILDRLRHVIPGREALFCRRILVIGVGRAGRAMMREVKRKLPREASLRLFTCAIDWACMEAQEADYLFRLHDSLTGSGCDPLATMIQFRATGFHQWLAHQYFEQVFVLGGLQGGTAGTVLPQVVAWLADRHIETCVCGVLPLDFEVPADTSERASYQRAVETLDYFLPGIDLHLVSASGIAGRIGECRSVWDIFQATDERVAGIVAGCLRDNG